MKAIAACSTSGAWVVWTTGVARPGVDVSPTGIVLSAVDLLQLTNMTEIIKINRNLFNTSFLLIIQHLIPEFAEKPGKYTRLLPGSAGQPWDHILDHIFLS
jgi:hypothetical protein